ncbi:hypothetical protein [Sorangium sp. So ce363]|uniref:hypothetical protein n=1 Tax=Sorangium sp. So ce363 TaxID=3133304 RepID=UPI003F5DC573
MHAGPSAHRAASMTIAAVLVCACAPRAARADSVPLDGLERAIAVGVGLSLLPSELGGDLALGSKGGGRFLAAWSFQIPVVLDGSEPKTAVLTNHRVVLAPGLAFGEQRGATAGEQADVTFRARAGYRGVYHPSGGAFGFLAGLGTTVEFWPVVRPSLSPEIGLHLGPCCSDASGNATLILRGDAWLAGPDALRASAVLGWAFY